MSCGVKKEQMVSLKMVPERTLVRKQVSLGDGDVDDDDDNDNEEGMCLIPFRPKDSL